MKESITLFHTTNEISAQSMIRNGIGLNLNDYQKYITSICKDLDVSPEKVSPILKLFKDDSEANGGVSFFQDNESCLRIAHYAKFGGEWREQIIERTLKRIARIKSTPYKSIKHIGIKYLGIDSKPVIVKVILPIDMIANPEQIGKRTEIYTKSKVPAEYILEYNTITDC